MLGNYLYLIAYAHTHMSVVNRTLKHFRCCMIVNVSGVMKHLMKNVRFSDSYFMLRASCMLQKCQRNYNIKEHCICV